MLTLFQKAVLPFQFGRLEEFSAVRMTVVHFRTSRVHESLILYYKDSQFFDLSERFSTIFSFFFRLSKLSSRGFRLD